MMNRRLLIAVLVLGQLSLHAMSVEEAYRAIPHQRTVFDPSSVAMPAATAAALTQLFVLADRAIVAKMSVMRESADPEALYPPMLTAIDAVKTPAELRLTKALIRSSVDDEYAYLRGWRAHHPDRRYVTSSSQSLHQAYDELTRLYPNENTTNKQAFFDYLCALDFQ